VFDRLFDEALAGYDRIIGLDLSEVSVDGSLHKAPCGGKGTGRNPTDRGKLGWKWSVATDRNGIPIGWAIDGANRHDIPLFAPTLDTIQGRGLLAEIDTLHLDRGYDAGTIRRSCAKGGITDTVIARRRKPGEPKPASPPVGMGLRWAVERTNSWLSNFGQMRRNTDRSPRHRHAQLALATALILTVKLLKWAKRWSPPRPA
jgi:transposase